MEISVYASEEFANENTPLYKIANAYYKDVLPDESNPLYRGFRDIDKSHKTTLSALYADGWRISSVTNEGDLFHMFFMERG